MVNDISILNIIEDTTVDGPGFRTSIYAAGCPHRCAGCHNPHSWKVGNGTLYSIDYLMQRIKQAEFANVTFSGGDPFAQPEAFARLARRIKAETTKTIWCYTGYLFEAIVKNHRLSALLADIDVLVDGPFVESLKDEDLLFRGSSNQRLIDVQKSLQQQTIILWGENRLSNSNDFAA